MIGFVGPAVSRGLSSRGLRPSISPIRASPSPLRQHFHRALPIRAVYKTVEDGEKTSFDFRVKFADGSKQISPWHDIPLYANTEKTLLNYINEIPKGTSAKMEIATDETFTPIKQDIKKGELRFYKYSASLVNYGALPQTWEDPNFVNPDTGFGGDDDPVDVIEISDDAKPMGAVYAVKPFGVLALIDDGETDWKVLAIDAEDPNAKQINNVDDAKKLYPGLIEKVTDWFKMYKTAEGKGENEYAFGGEAKDPAYTMSVVSETHESYLKLKTGKIPNEKLSMR